MLFLLFETTILFEQEDITHLFESNYKSIQKYHEKCLYCLKDDEYYYNKVMKSKRILDMCDVQIVREMFK
jgi:hypothetical protein